MVFNFSRIFIFHRVFLFEIQRVIYRKLETNDRPKDRKNRRKREKPYKFPGIVRCILFINGNYAEQKMGKNNSTRTNQSTPRSRRWWFPTYHSQLPQLWIPVLGTFTESNSGYFVTGYWPERAWSIQLGSGFVIWLDWLPPLQSLHP